MKIKKYVLSILFLSILLFLSIAFYNKSYASLYLNNLNFDVQVNSDASMNITEIWDIDIEETNTLFKTFKTDKTKYSEIKDVTVTDITNSNEIAFNKINNLMYHVTKNCYYGLINDDGNFEIAWGVGLDNSSATRKYMIQYKVENAIAKYNDYAELYWQFVGNDFEIDSSKITGKIRLPMQAESSDNIKVWGHTEGLNGEIYATSNDTVEFEINKFKSGRFVEVRTLFPSDMISYSTRTFYENRLESVVAEETVWANEANARRLRRQKFAKVVTGVAGAIYAFVSGTFLKKSYNGIKKAKEINPYKKTENVEYFREIPRDNATPSQAISMYKKYVSAFSSTEIGRIFSAVLLDLCLKKCIEFEVSPENKKEVKIKIIKRIQENLQKSEKIILDFIVNISKEKDEITVKELQKYMKNHATKVAKIKEHLEELNKKEIIENKLYDEKRAEERNTYAGTSYGYTISMLFILAFGSFWVAPLISGKVILYGIVALAATAIINIIATKQVTKKLQPFTDEGLNESAKWNGLKKFMVNFSMLDKREIPELELWEHYLVYATAFGVADKVLKQLKIVYKDVYENMNNYGYMYLMMNTDFSSSFSNAISSSVSSSYTSTLSSGSGSGGGFSGGGGGGRRWPEAVAEDSHN